jgi:hypothetical protein
MTNPRLSALLSSSAKRLGLAACVSALALGGISAAQAQDGSPMQIPDYRGSLRTMIAELSGYAKGRNPDFLIITREGIGLTVKEKREADVERLLHPAVNGEEPPTMPIGSPHRRFVRALDAVVMNDQYCVPVEDSTASRGFIRMLQDTGLKVMSVDHCADRVAVAKALVAARQDNVLAYADTLPQGQDRVPRDPPAGENANNINGLGDARNILFLDGNAGYASKDDLVLAVEGTNWDIVVLDAFHRDRTPLTRDDVFKMKFKKVGTRRLMIARLQISQARDTRFYWKSDWQLGSPEWISAPVVSQPGTYDVKFWSAEWQAIVGRTFTALMDLGFDGVVIEGPDAYKPLEAKIPLDF